MSSKGLYVSRENVHVQRTILTNKINDIIARFARQLDMNVKHPALSKEDVEYITRFMLTLTKMRDLLVER